MGEWEGGSMLLGWVPFFTLSIGYPLVFYTHVFSHTHMYNCVMTHRGEMTSLRDLGPDGDVLTHIPNSSRNYSNRT